MKNIALGQYYPAQSPLHRLDARMKLILSILYIVCTFLCKNVLSFALLLVSAAVLLLLSRIPPRIVLRSLRALLFIMLFTTLLNLFFIKGEVVLLDLRFTKIYLEGIYGAAFMLVRIMVLILSTSLFLTYTTSPIALTDAIERLLSPLKVIKLPVHEFAMMMTIALRFIPTLVEETDKIMSAQKARGADFSSGGLVKRAKALLPVLIPLFASSFRRAGELATAMECRCYRGDNGRTRMTKLKTSWVDLVLFILFAAFGAGIILMNIYLGFFLNFGIAL
jgi:energy-coupling factor transport system permease protein